MKQHEHTARKRWIPALRGLALASAVLTGLAAADPAGPLRHKNWWNFYERGQESLGRGEYQAALEDFERALGERPGAKYGYDTDQWRIRTYGMHMLDDYFPNREAGICHYHLGHLEEAARHLETSLAQTPSGRARHYLNLVHREAMSGQVIPPPQIDLEDGLEVHWTSARDWKVSGRATARGRVRGITINDHREFIELAEERIAFERSLPLKEGLNVVRIGAEDLFGTRGEREARVIADWASPVLSITGITREGGAWRVEGAVADDHGLSMVVLENQTLFDSADPAASRRMTFSERIPADGGMRLVAVDRAGNRLVADLRDAVLAGQARAGIRFAQAEPGTPDVSEPVTPQPDAKEADTLKPSLRLSISGNKTVVFDDQYFVDGRIQDNGGIVSITLNGEDQVAPEDRGAVQVYFSRHLSLAIGTNLFRISVSDVAGNTVTREFEVVRRIPAYLGDRYRLTMGVPPPLGPAGEESRADQVQRLLENEILREPVRFHLLERDEGWEYILLEQELSMSDLADPRSALRIGKMLPANLLLMASVRRQGDGLTVVARVVDSADGRLKFVEDIYAVNPETDMAFQLAGLVLKIEQKFPLVQGVVSQVRKTSATLDIGADDGVQSDMIFIVAEAGGGPDPVAEGNVRTAGADLIELRADKIRRNQTTANILPGQHAGTVRPGDIVYAR